MAKLNIHSTSKAESQSRFECGLEMALAGADCVPWEYPQVKSRLACSSHNQIVCVAVKTTKRDSDNVQSNPNTLNPIRLTAFVILAMFPIYPGTVLNPIIFVLFETLKNYVCLN